MGLDIRTAEFLLHCRNLGVDFSNVCTLGRQRVMLSTIDKKRLSSWVDGLDMNGEIFADRFLKALGAHKPSAMDVSEYEDADILHNLNADLPDTLRDRFSCLIDGGTLEHIFDFRQALKSCMQMVRPGGHLIICQMANNCMGHGFYQLSPELFYSALTPENGYEVKFMALSEKGVWYQPLPPTEVGERIQAQTSGETFIYVMAKRISNVEPFLTPPHQSDYVSNLDQHWSAPQPVQTAAFTSQLKQGLKVIRGRLGALKRDHVIPAFPLLGDLEDRYRQYRITRPDRLSNARRFRKLGKRLHTSLSMCLCYIAADLLPLLELSTSPATL